ncbi:hypothetical protein [Leptospira stimsonii]|uniref:Uncharacterized protein n=1 Tax=Leptospira stimsonii TaxID=2202203 RepID=A0ABY2N577_9LEPT|nr:hypothetical protein [Leptospira stimsonii]TGK10394.1 hypothetical protein EHO98_23070 [Leptospira stimsonii]TGM17263.1 hypothetical protein EHQ90_07725 [Leptospira stimsonii]
MNLSFSLGSNGFPENGRKGNLNISNTALRILLDDLKAELWYDPEEIELVALEMVPDLFNWSAYILNMTLRTKCLTLRLI